MKKLAVLTFLIFLSVCGSQAFAVEPGVYNFFGTCKLEAIFATGGTGTTASSGSSRFCIEGLNVSAPDGDGVQTITGPNTAGYGVTIRTITMIIPQIDLYATGRITGYIDTLGGNVPAQVRTWAKEAWFLPCGWWTETTEPTGNANTVVMTIPLDSNTLPDPPYWAEYGDPDASSLKAIAQFDTYDSFYEEEIFTSRMRSGYGLRTDNTLKLVSPDAHFEGGMIIMPTISFTTFEGTFSTQSCPSVWGPSSTVDVPAVSSQTSQVSRVSNYLIVSLLPALALFILLGYTRKGKRKKK
jgi:hypothetical protein